MNHSNFQVKATEEKKAINDTISAAIPNFTKSFVFRSIARPWPKDDTLEGTRLVLHNIDNRISWLAARDLRPHINVLNRRNETLEKITQFESCLAPINKVNQ